MGKLATQTLIEKKLEQREKKIDTDLSKLYKEAFKQGNIIGEAGRGSRRANTALTKMNSLYKKIDNLEEKKGIPLSKAVKDDALVEKYGESAMEARSFGTDREVDYSFERRIGKKPYKVQSTPKAKGGYVKKYAKGGGVRKVRK